MINNTLADPSIDTVEKNEQSINDSVKNIENNPNDVDFLKQYFLNGIALVNSISKRKNLIKLPFYSTAKLVTGNKSIVASTFEKREQNIRKALSDLQQMENLADFTVTSAYARGLLSVGKKMTGIKQFDTNNFNPVKRRNINNPEYFNNKYETHETAPTPNPNPKPTPNPEQPKQDFFSRITSFNPFTKKNGGGKKYKTRKYKKTHKIYKHYK